MIPHLERISKAESTNLATSPIKSWVACAIFRLLTAGRASETGLPIDDDYELFFWHLGNAVHLMATLT